MSIFNVESRLGSSYFSGPTMKGLAVFSRPEDDPYITSHKDDSEDEREREAMTIKAEDNLAVVAKFDGVSHFLLL